MPDITGWSYQEATGLLLSKTYADNNSVSYEYDIKGNLTKRTWARAVLTNYAYNSLDEMTGITYSDATPAVSFTYNRIGQQKTVTDVVGTRTFSYNDKLQLTGESINGIYNKLLTRSYDALGRSSVFAIEGDNYAVAYGYDNLNRMNSLTSGTDVFSYAYLPNSNLISTITMPNGITTTKSYEANRNLITSVENKFNAITVSKYDYVNDVVGRRSSMAKSGTAFNVADTIDYGYNSKSEVISAVAQNDTAYNFAYNFDKIGNRITATEAGASTAYVSNNLNQYSAVSNNNPAYDLDGNMLDDGTGWAYTWDAENRLKTAEKGLQKLEFAYDYMSRRVEKKLFNGLSLSKHEKFVYDKFKLIEKLDGSNFLKQQFVWSGERLLSVTDSATAVKYYYVQDVNKNITELLDNSGNITAHYEYSPFGKIITSSGAYATDNPYRFSSEYADDETGLIYYNYRYYSAELGKWVSRDPVKERGGINLYGMTENSPINKWDMLGQACCGTQTYDPSSQCCNNDNIINGQSKSNCNYMRGKLKALYQTQYNLDSEIANINRSMERLAMYNETMENIGKWGDIASTVTGFWGRAFARPNGLDWVGVPPSLTAIDEEFPSSGESLTEFLNLPSEDQALAEWEDMLIQARNLQQQNSNMIRETQQYLDNNCGTCEK